MRATSIEVADGAARRVSRGIMLALERSELQPGQRLVETELAARFNVGRNAVREAIQWLAAHNVVDMSRHRSSALRRLDAAETADVIEVSVALLGLLAGAAARCYEPTVDAGRLRQALDNVGDALDDTQPGAFARACRHFYRSLLQIGGNRELQRLFPSLGLHILFAQYRQAIPQRRCLDDFRALVAAVEARDAEVAQVIGRAHMARFRSVLEAPKAA